MQRWPICGTGVVHSPEFEEYFRSPEWRRFRDHLIIKNGGHCQWCGFLFPLSAMVVHHKNYYFLTLGKPWKHEKRDVLVICRWCHADADRERRAEVNRDLAYAQISLGGQPRERLDRATVVWEIANAFLTQLDCDLRLATFALEPPGVTQEMLLEQWRQQRHREAMFSKYAVREYGNDWTTYAIDGAVPSIAGG